MRGSEWYMMNNMMFPQVGLTWMGSRYDLQPSCIRQRPRASNGCPLAWEICLVQMVCSGAWAVYSVWVFQFQLVEGLIAE